MNDIARHLDTVKSTLPAGVSLVAVSKFHPAEPFGRHTMRDNVFSEKAGFKSWSLSRPYSPPISNGTLSAICRPIK